ncbi:MAG: alternative ribosome rescue aminoacyl-tRNA hydrolase ArfB [Planctomycetota bacterium]|nr:alternative ribosome rescue aminoacyl-tRNA hydrolase ArfB [Planctomycetota bacterium]
MPREKLQIGFSRSSGPGGQNVNKVSTRAEIRFHLGSADWLPAAVRKRLAALCPRRLNREGEFIVVSSRYRSQGRNLDDCIEKLEGLIEKATRRPRRRVPTRKTRASNERRLDKKKRRGQVKSRRRRPPEG